MVRTVLGINADRDGFSAAVVVDGLVVSAVEQFKIREHWTPREDEVLPKASVTAALQVAQVNPRAIDGVAISSSHLQSVECFLPHIPSLGVNDRARIEQVDPRVSHSAMAFYSSAFDRAAILVLGSGTEDGTFSLANGNEGRIELEETSGRDLRLIEQYCRISRALGFHNRTSNKVAWLGSTGEPEFLEVFREFMSLDYQNPNVEEILRRINLDKPGNVAASLQARTNELVVQITDNICRRRHLSKICLAGFLSENPLLVRQLEQHFGADSVFVPPAPGPESLSIGAALTVSRRESGAHDQRCFPYPALGPEFSDAEIKTELDNCKLVTSFIPGKVAFTVNICKALADGCLVGWFQGRCEFGHRALGFRSIVANPFTPYVDENINRFLKHRESFHPFAISVPEEEASDYFDNVGVNARTIASVYAVNSAKRNLLSRFAVQDTWVRVHTVRSADNHLFWTLLREIKKCTGHPLLINTSFNLPGEPLVMTPRDAIRSFYASGLDVLAIGGFQVTK